MITRTEAGVIDRTENSLCVPTAATAASLSTAGAKSPAVIFSEDAIDEGAMGRYERLMLVAMDAKLAAYRRAARESREREIEACQRTAMLEKCLAEIHRRSRAQHSVSAVLAVALVLAVFALLA